MIVMAEQLIQSINAVIWGVPMMILLVGCGIYMTTRLSFFQITHINVWIKETFGTLFLKNNREGRGITPYQAVSSALASSIGTGSIVGVATAISAGGAGAVFWMWVSAFFGMATKYAEVFLAVRFRKKKGDSYIGGPMYYMEDGLGKGYKWLACTFAVFGALACIGMGAMSQANSISTVVRKGIGIPSGISGIILAILALIAVSGGISRISALAERIVPVMAIIYLAGGVIIVAMHPFDAMNAFSEILLSALCPRAIYGGVAGEMVRRALRFGVARGVFSNEAGLGSSPIVHAAADAKNPITQGYWGIFEVFVDTMVVCSVTAVTVVMSKSGGNNLSGVELVVFGFSKYFGAFGTVFVDCAIVVFSMTTILGWSYYGEQCVMYLSGNKKSAGYFYRALFVLGVMTGACLSLDIVWEIADMFNGLMAAPNIIALFMLSGTVISETRKHIKNG